MNIKSIFADGKMAWSLVQKVPLVKSRAISNDI